MTPKPKGNRFGFKDLGIGIGLRTAHYGHILSTWPKIDWFEVLYSLRVSIPEAWRELNPSVFHDELVALLGGAS